MKIVFPLYCKIFFDLLVRNIFPVFDEFLFCLCLVSLLTFKEIATIHFFQDNGLMTFFLILFVDCFLKFFILYFFFLASNIYFGMFGVSILTFLSFGDTCFLWCLFQGLVYMVWIFLGNLELLETVVGSLWLHSDS